MDDLGRRLASLSPAKRALLERMLQNGAAAPQVETIPRRTGAEPAPLSFAQQRLWFLDQLEPGSSMYNIPSVFRLHGPLDSIAVKRCFEEVLRRHEALRTTFQAVDGRPRQVIAESFEFSLPAIDLRQLSESNREAEALRLAEEEANRPFDLSRDLMLRARLICLADDEHWLALTMHHIASDGWSLGVFWREFEILYAAFSVGEPTPSAERPALPELPVQYADYAIWQRDWLQGEVLKQQSSYWKNRLEGAPAVLELPADFPRPAVQKYLGTRIEFSLDGELTQALREFSRREGATLFMTLLAAWQVLLARYSGQEDIVVGSVIAGRNRTELENMIGFFANTIALRSDLSGNPPFRKLLAQVREVTLGAYAHPDLPFEKLIEDLHPERNLSHTPLIQVMLVLQNTPQKEKVLRGLTFSPVKVASPTAKFDLTFSLREAPQGLSGWLTYNTDLYKPETIARLLGHFEVLLAGIVADPDRPIGKLPLLTDAERRQVLVDFNGTPAGESRPASIPELFEMQVEKTPDAVALVCGDERLAYRQLNERANRFARDLVARGVGPETLVALCVERSPQMLVGLLAVVKAGGRLCSSRPRVSSFAPGADAGRRRPGPRPDDERPPPVFAPRRRCHAARCASREWGARSRPLGQPDRCRADKRA